MTTEDDPRDYLISTQEGEFHDLRLTWSGDRSLLYISTNHRTFGMSAAMAQELSHGLMALLHGGFGRAISEVALRREQDDIAFRNSRITTTTKSASSTPELDQL